MRHSELLEPRRLLASVYQGLPGYYEVSGTDGNDSIDIVVEQGARTFTLDGVTYGGVLHLSVFAGAGDDTVSVGGGGSRGTISAAVEGGPGRDKISLNMNGAAWGGAGPDEISLRNAFRGEAYGGDGDDYISVAGACIDCQLEGNEGNDIIWAIDNAFGVVLYGGPGNDRLYGSYYDDIIFDGPGADWLFGLAGDDALVSRDGERDWVMGGDGYDTLWCDNAEGGVYGCEYVSYG